MGGEPPQGVEELLRRGLRRVEGGRPHERGGGLQEVEHRGGRLVLGRENRQPRLPRRPPTLRRRRRRRDLHVLAVPEGALAPDGVVREGHARRTGRRRVDVLPAEVEEEPGRVRVVPERDVALPVVHPGPGVGVLPPHVHEDPGALRLVAEADPARGPVHVVPGEVEEHPRAAVEAVAVVPVEAGPDVVPGAVHRDPRREVDPDSAGVAARAVGVVPGGVDEHPEREHVAPALADDRDVVRVAPGGFREEPDPAVQGHLPVRRPRPHPAPRALRARRVVRPVEALAPAGPPDVVPAPLGEDRDPQGRGAGLAHRADPVRVPPAPLDEDRRPEEGEALGAEVPGVLVVPAALVEERRPAERRALRVVAGHVPVVPREVHEERRTRRPPTLREPVGPVDVVPGEVHVDPGAGAGERRRRGVVPVHVVAPEVEEEDVLVGPDVVPGPADRDASERGIGLEEEPLPEVRGRGEREGGEILAGLVPGGGESLRGLVEGQEVHLAQEVQGLEAVGRVRRVADDRLAGRAGADEPAGEPRPDLRPLLVGERGERPVAETRGRGERGGQIAEHRPDLRREGGGFEAGAHLRHPRRGGAGEVHVPQAVARFPRTSRAPDPRARRGPRPRLSPGRRPTSRSRGG